jgi:glutamine synthetase
MSKEDVLKLIKDEDAAYVDIRFTDPRGKLQHVTVMSDLVDEDFLDEGFMFDGSSIAGWKGIEASDMKLMPDTESAYVDPFYAEKTICLHCSVLEPDTGEAYKRDPRGTARKGRGLSQVVRHRRRGLFRAPRRNSSSSTTCVSPTR